MLRRNPATETGGSPVRRAGGVAATVLALAAGLLATPVQATESSGRTSSGYGDLTVVQANIYSGLTVPQFQADVRRVLDIRPDFITYNEVPLRNDLVLAPPAEGWAIHRSHENRYKSATAVAWRTDRWSKVDSGTYRISNYRGKPPGRNIELGRRFANWATLTSPDGRVVSVVSVHVAPLAKGMPDLRRRSVKRLGGLVEELSPRGPVLVGGDFNVHYKSSIYPRDLLDAADLVPTYDMLGTYFPTGDHQGATIDYVFGRVAGQTWAAAHRAVELRSDHDAVVADFSWLVDAPAETREVANDPTGDRTARRTVVEALAGTIRDAEPGAVIEVVTKSFDQRAMFRQLNAAMVRGVHVRMTSRSVTPTRRERRLERRIEEHRDAQSWFRRCLDACNDSWKEAGGTPGFMMVSDPEASWRIRIDSDTDFRNLVERQTRLVVRTGRYGLADGEKLLAAAY